MKTLVIYDLEGTILLTRAGDPQPKEPVGVPFLWVEIPADQQLDHEAGVDVSTDVHKAILKDIPKTETELLREELAELKQQTTFHEEVLTEVVLTINQ